MFNKNWPRIYERKKKGIDYWVLDSRRYHNGVRSGTEEYFNQEKYSRKQVEGRSDVVRHEASGNSPDIETLTSRVTLEAHEANAKLKPYRKTISQAVEFYVNHLEEQAKGGVELKKAIEDWTQIKKDMFACGDIKERSFVTIEHRIGLFEKAFDGKNLMELSTDVITPFFRDPKYSARTRANIKSVVSEFFLWCVRSKKWLKDNPCDAIEVKVKVDEVQILTVAQSKKLLDAACSCLWADEWHPYVLLGLFAGLRPSELQCLTWADIDFDANEIRVDSDQLRYVPMSQDLSHALKRYHKKGLIVSESNFRKRWDFVRLSAGFEIAKASDPIKKYPFDGMRHSFASYWLSINNDRPRLAEIMGNSVGMIRNHYRRAIPVHQAKAFMNLLTPALVTA